MDAILAAVGLAAVGALIWMPAGAGRRGRSAFQYRAESRRNRRIPSATAAVVAGAAVSTVAAAFWLGPLAALGMGGVGALCVWAVLIRVASGRAVRAAADMAQFCSSLANQSTVATTVEDALRKAAPVATGAMEEPAKNLAADAERFGVAEAANRFSRDLGTPSARRIGAVVATAGSGGSGWAYLAKVAQDMATEELKTQQHFHRWVAGVMPQVVSALAVSVGTVAIVGFAMPEAGEWFKGPAGQLVLLVTTVLWCSMVGKVCSTAWKSVR